MGMYTELDIGVKLKKDTPSDVINELKLMVDEENADLQQFRKERPDRWYWMLKSGGSYYFHRKPSLHFEYDDMDQTYYLSVCTNIKNYEREWEKFLEWLTPYIATTGFIGTYRYEEDESPTLLYMDYNGNMIWQNIDVPEELQ